MEALFDCTLDMINKNLEEFPEHRIHFFRMLQSITSHCFPGKYVFVLLVAMVAVLSTCLHLLMCYVHTNLLVSCCLFTLLSTCLLLI